MTDEPDLLAEISDDPDDDDSDYGRGYAAGRAGMLAEAVTALDLRDIFTTSEDGRAVLGCELHSWTVDVEETDLPSVIRHAEDHVRAKHGQVGQR